MSSRNSRRRTVHGKENTDDFDGNKRITRTQTPQPINVSKHRKSNRSDSEDDWLDSQHTNGSRKSLCKTPSTSIPNENDGVNVRRSGRKRTPNKRTMFLYQAEMDRLKARKRKDNKAKQEPELNSSQECKTDSSNSIDENMPEELERAPALFDQNIDVAGENLFTFRTPKKRNGMALLAATTPKTPKTPATIFKSLSLNSPRTPKSHHKELTTIETTKTPYHTRNKLKQAVRKRLESDDEDDESDATDDEDPDFMKDKSDESSSETQGESAEEKSSDDEDAMQSKHKYNNNRMLNKTVVIRKPLETATVSCRSTRLQRRKELSEPDFMPQSDNYFNTISNKKMKTSDHTLDRLKSSRLQYDELFGILRSLELSDEHRVNTTEMIQDLEQNFTKWMLMLSKGYNIIIYGIGSKQCVLQKFCDIHLAERPVIIINGFFPTLTVKDILHSIKTEIVTLNANARNDHEIVDGIAEAFQRSPKTHLFLIIHNLDGPMLRKTKDQHILSRLAKIKNIHLVASIDHINAPLMWDQTCMSNYNFLWWDCTTMLPYTNETAFENSIFLQNSGELGLAAMNNVFQSLTTNARGVYMLLVEAQISNKKDSNYQGMAFKDLYHGCRERFLVSSDLALRTQLIEFVDHNMAKTKRSIDGTEHVLIPIDLHVLEQFVEQQKE